MHKDKRKSGHHGKLRLYLHVRYLHCTVFVLGIISELSYFLPTRSYCLNDQTLTVWWVNTTKQAAVCLKKFFPQLLLPLVGQLFFHVLYSLERQRPTYETTSAVREKTWLWLSSAIEFWTSQRVTCVLCYLLGCIMQVLAAVQKLKKKLCFLSSNGCSCVF